MDCIFRREMPLNWLESWIFGRDLPKTKRNCIRKGRVNVLRICIPRKKTWNKSWPYIGLPLKINRFCNRCSVMRSKKLLNVNYTLGPYRSFVDKMIELAHAKRSTYVCVSAVHMFIEAYKDESFAAILNKAEMVTPDGKPLTWALRFLYGIKKDRVAGMDLLPDLLSEAENQNLPVAFYGGTDNMLEKTKEHITKKYPNLVIAKMYSPPFRPLKTEEEESIIKIFNDSGA